MIKLTQEKVLALHTFMIEQTGGADGLRDFGLLDSALESAYATFGGEELFKTTQEKAARIGVGLVSNHAFVDGNKRIGMFILLIFLKINGVVLHTTDEKIVEVGLRLAEGKMGYEELLQWINAQQQ
jgi:death-on-curing protein